MKLNAQKMEKKYESGMVLGKFMPPHNGHLFLIDTAITECEVVHVFVCSLKKEPIPGILRYKWLTKIYEEFDSVNVIWVTDENPQDPGEFGWIDGFYDIWVKSVRSRVKDLDVIFTSEEYGDEFAKRLGIEHVLVDLPRETIPISATAIRRNPIAQWSHIPRVVRPHFKIKVAVLGPESTGKSTLIKKLAEHYGGDYVEEYGRDYTGKVPGVGLTEEDFESIANEQHLLIKDVVDNGESPYVFVDTEALTTFLFGKMYLGDTFNSGFISKKFREQEFDMYLLCDVDVPWINDGTRDFPKQRWAHFESIEFSLFMLNQPYEIIHGDYDERFNSSVKVIDELIEQKFVFSE